jgi:hypothetical protein
MRSRGRREDSTEEKEEKKRDKGETCDDQVQAVHPTSYSFALLCLSVVPGEVEGVKEEEESLLESKLSHHLSRQTQRERENTIGRNIYHSRHTVHPNGFMSGW